MKHAIQHGLDPAIARRVADAAIKSYLERFQQYSPSLTWTDPTHAEIAFSAKGVSIRGTFTLAPGAIEVEMEVPFVFKLFKSQAIRIIEEEVQRWVTLAKDGKLGGDGAA
ncbi:MAG: polyhydroxyalkanoic acid system family protein [Deltaproteobacteria bacterium]|nr:polyhydroxyalkanoic acid system family protein [Deltaproteobacteria bacterium]